ncbi:CMRF35-like molecule 7 isoform X1 [Marmota marmota marmota]|uniref:Uncharacterized LOC107143627 n=1 Tax=Marmota marmota marmota TaxID=9994 RepID=A0A8C6EZP6_MARMA|nr:CMRF35-like molecule 7 isoform X1 [Marmota marmota marmota]
MAQEATHLIPLILMVLLASGSWAQNTEFLQKPEGEMIVVRCWYKPSQRSKVKTWCRKMPANYCTLLVGRGRKEPQSSIQDQLKLDYFEVTMTKLRVNDSGVYYCGIYENTEVYILRTIHLKVFKASTPPTTRSIRMTTAMAFATSPVIGSPSGYQKWIFISSGVVVAVLLLGFIVLMVLYLRKARGRDRKGEKESHHIYEDISDHKEVKAPGFHQQILSDEDTGAICYASLIHLNHFGTEDSIYSNTHPNSNLKPVPDPLQTVEYASITGKRLPPSPPAALSGEPGN